MASQLRCTGPAHIYVSFSGLNSQAQYLGTAEQSPRIQVQLNFEPIANDIGGREPMDDSYQGQSALIEANLNRWDELAYTNLEAQGPDGIRGVDSLGDIGTILRQEGQFFVAFVLFPYGVGGLSPVNAMSDMPPGYRFVACHLANDVQEQLGTKPKRLQVIFQARRLYNPGTTGATIAIRPPGGYRPTAPPTPTILANILGSGGSICPIGGWILYDHNVTGLPLPS